MMFEILGESLLSFFVLFALFVCLHQCSASDNVHYSDARPFIKKHEPSNVKARRKVSTRANILTY